MTQSGQGDEPSAQPAREGIVLPSDGGEPLLPGTTGDRTSPAGGQAWGQPWGPEQPAAPAPQPDQGWGAQVNGAQPWGAAEQPQSTAPAPDWGTPEASQGWAAQQQPGAGDYQQQSFAPQPAPGAGPLPPEGAQAPSYGAQGGFAPEAQGAHAGAGYGGYAAQGRQGQQAAHPSDPGNALPQAPDAYGTSGSSPSLPPAPLPPAADDGATQFIPPVPAPADEGATQYIPLVGPGALPPEVPADATQFLGQAPQGGPGAGPLPAVAHPDAEATQFIAPVPAQPSAAPYGIRPGGPEDRQPPAEFDSLFRSEPEGPASTQQMPRFDPSAQDPYGGAQAAYGAQAPYGAHAPGAPGGRAAARRGGGSDGDGGGGRGGRSGSRVPLIAAVGIGIAVLGIGAGALLSGGDGSDSKSDGSKTVSATAPTTAASPAADPAKAQAVELDKLLADSSSSRDSVINAVADVKTCDNLGKAASDLRDAAKQRGELVTRLAALPVDKLPNHAQLTTALTNGWKASASADNHYAAWADQVDGRKGCRKGHARTTPQRQAGDQASGTASTEKEKAAKLWNAIASKYGLTQRSRTQL
ncbi:hypothetical protein GCM10011579_027580 [Streptomyces albiflavescens]|uniref:Uncharacterized protein n=1 Tax=Streptomyces albiflavescens TaxID=1623582 RepID=A0A918D3E4_9ACTN|nr:hypothetical protein [Streptomyces albiflavescens]GGN61356.1 hypothetical protein GCM10011579_027580 [Streptomyces albiflavescens]